jgi:methylase of polypeptide subunit release factors
MSDSTVNFEPDLALYGWKTGFELYEILIGQCLQLWKKWADIDLYIEIGFDQKNIAMNFLTEKQLDFEFFKDSATIERVVYIHGF